MGIKGTEKLGDWGKKIPTNQNNTHITQTNKTSKDGKGVHITTNIPSTKAKVHDSYDSKGNYKGSDFGKR